MLNIQMTMFYRTPEECEQERGFWHIAGEFNGLQEFMKRADALQSLKNTVPSRILRAIVMF